MDKNKLFIKHLAQIRSDELCIQRAMMKGKTPQEVLRITQELQRIAKEYEVTRI